MIEIYTDGSCRNNGKKHASGGCAFVVTQDSQKLYEESFFSEGTTNQRMELLAAIKACNFIKNHFPDENVRIYSDSAYLINCFSQRWWIAWQYNGWKNAKGQPVANIDLWKQIIPFFKNDKFTFQKVKGHSKNRDSHSVYNNYVDLLAVSAARSIKEGESESSSN